MNQSKEQPIKGKEEILLEQIGSYNYAEIDLNKMLFKVIKAMEEYKDQFVQSGEERLREALEKIADITLDCYTQVEVAEIREIALAATGEIKGQRLFTLKEALDIWEAGRMCGGAGHLPSHNCEPKYFKEKFGIDL